MLLLRGSQKGLRNRQKDEEERDMQQEKRGIIPCTGAGWESVAGKQKYREGPKALGGHKTDPEPEKCPCSSETQKQHQLHGEGPWQQVKGGANSSLSALECLVQCWAAESMDTVSSARSHKDNKGVATRGSENCGCLAWRREDFGGILSMCRNT